MNYAPGEWSKVPFQLGYITNAQTCEAEGTESGATSFLDPDGEYEIGEQRDLAL